MEKIQKTPEKMVFISGMNISLANAIRRSVYDVPIIAIDELDIYKNDSALYDEIIANRIGLIPLKNQKMKKGQVMELKLKSKNKEVLSGEMGEDLVVYTEMPITLLENGQEIEVVAKTKVGTGKEHAKFVPGLLYYHELKDVKVSHEGEKHSELAEFYPNLFEFSNGKLKTKNEWACDLEQEDMKEFPGVKVDSTDKLVFNIESWGQIEAKDIFLESVEALRDNLKQLSKSIK